MGIIRYILAAVKVQSSQGLWRDTYLEIRAWREKLRSSSGRHHLLFLQYGLEILGVLSCVGGGFYRILGRV